MPRSWLLYLFQIHPKSGKKRQMSVRIKEKGARMTDFDLENRAWWQDINEDLKELEEKFEKELSIKYNEIENLKNKINNIKIKDLINEDKELNDLKPDDIFKKKCDEAGFNLSENTEILDAFYQILNQVKDKNT